MSGLANVEEGVAAAGADRAPPIAGVTVAAPARSRVWTCPRCTLDNSIGGYACAACGLRRARQRAPRPPSSHVAGMLLRAAVAGMAGLALGRASTHRGSRHFVYTALAVAAVPLGTALLHRLLGGDAQQPAPGAAMGPPGAAVSRDRRRRQLRLVAQQAADEGAAAGAITGEELQMLQLVMQPSQSRTERVQSFAHVLAWLRRVEADPAPRSRSTQLVSAVVVYELNALVDEMSYDEIYDAFGGPPPAKALAEEAISALPCRQLTADSIPALHSNTCSICLDCFQPGDTARELRCSHTFHSACLDTWLRNRALCPVCRDNVEAAPP